MRRYQFGVGATPTSGWLLTGFKVRPRGVDTFNESHEVCRAISQCYDQDSDGTS